VGKVFVVVDGMRRCLICDGMFTPTQAAHHSAIICVPPSTDSGQGEGTLDPCSPSLPPIDCSSSLGQA
jgi:hypothetical protein